VGGAGRFGCWVRAAAVRRLGSSGTYHSIEIGRGDLKHQLPLVLRVEPGHIVVAVAQPLRRGKRGEETVGVVHKGPRVEVRARVADAPTCSSVLMRPVTMHARSLRSPCGTTADCNASEAIALPFCATREAKVAFFYSRSLLFSPEIPKGKIS